MVKISIKKEEKTVKPRQRQKQKQSQRVVVNIGSDVIKPKRRRAPRQALQKNNIVNKQQTTPTQINVPQALPIQQQQPKDSINEFIKYFKENESQKEAIKVILKEKDQKINELEKDKKDKDRSKDLTKEEVQDDFSRVYNNSNISSLTNSGTATPLFSKPVDPSQLYDLLRKEADLRGGNPNSGNISFSTLQSKPQSSNSTLTSYSPSSNSSQNTLTTLATNNTNQSNLSSFFDRSNRNEDLSTYMTKSPPKDPTETKMQSPSEYLSTYMTKSPPKDPTETKMKSKYDELFEDELDAQQVVSPEVVPAKEDPVIDEVLEEIEPENKIVVYGKQRAGSTSATATEQLIGIDNSSKEPFTRPINKPLPRINLKDVISEVEGLRGNKSDIREARLKFLEPERPQRSIKQSIDDEPVDIPTFTAEEMKAYKEKTKETRQAESTTPEPDNEAVGSSIEGYDEFQKYITDKEKKRKKEITNGTLGKMLIKNKITDPTTGKVFVLDSYNRVHVKGNSTALNNTQLTELLLNNYKPGFVYKKIS